MSALHSHARLLLLRELRRQRRLLAPLPAQRRPEVEAAIERAVLAATGAVVAESRRSPALAAALRATYGSADGASTGPVAAAGD